MSDEVSMFKWVIGGAVSAVATLTGVVWHENRERMKLLEAKLDHKADKSEMDKVEATQAKVFDLMRGIQNEIASSTLNLSNIINAKHLEVMAKLADKQDRAK